MTKAKELYQVSLSEAKAKMTTENDNQDSSLGPSDALFRQITDRLMEQLTTIPLPSTETSPQPMERNKRKEKKRVQTRRLTDNTFSTVMILDQELTPFTPHLRLHMKKFLQLERHERKNATHGGGIDSRVIVSGFHTEGYMQDARNFIKDRKDTLGVRPTDYSPRVMREKVKNYYNMCFRGETAALQVIVGEFRVARHWHDGRPKNTYCFKCRLLTEIGYLARPWQMSTLSDDKMMWFNMSDVDSESDDDIKKEVKLKREAKWAEDNVAGLPKGRGWRRSRRIQDQAATNTTPATVTTAQVNVEEANDTPETKTDNGSDDDRGLTVSPKVVKGLMTASRGLSAVVDMLQPEKKRKKKGKRRR